MVLVRCQQQTTTVSLVQVQKWREVKLTLRGWWLLPMEMHGCLVEADQCTVVITSWLGVWNL